MTKASRSHDEAVITLLREDPSIALCLQTGRHGRSDDISEAKR